MDQSKDTNALDLQNYRILSEAARNNEKLTLVQEEQLSRLATKLNLPNPMATKQSAEPQESEFLKTAKEHFVEDSQKSRRRGLVGTIISAVEVIGGAIILAFIINQFIFQPYEVVGVSMQPTLQSGDRLIVSKVPATWSKITHHKYTPKRYDIVVLKNTLARRFATNEGDIQLVKRVIGLPGDRVVIKDGHITVYNQENPEGFNPDENLVTKNVITTPDKEWTIKPDEIFVCGDNRPNSLDSRSDEIGPINVEHVVGHVRLRVLPINKTKVF